MTSCRMSVEADWRRDGVAEPLGDSGAGEPRGELIVGCDNRLNMDVNGGAPENVVCEGWRGARLGD